MELYKGDYIGTHTLTQCIMQYLNIMIIINRNYLELGIILKMKSCFFSFLNCIRRCSEKIVLSLKASFFRFLFYNNSWPFWKGVWKQKFGIVWLSYWFGKEKDPRQDIFYLTLCLNSLWVIKNKYVKRFISIEILGLMYRCSSDLSGKVVLWNFVNIKVPDEAGWEAEDTQDHDTKVVDRTALLIKAGRHLSSW